MIRSMFSSLTSRIKIKKNSPRRKALKRRSYARRKNAR